MPACFSKVVCSLMFDGMLLFSLAEDASFWTLFKICCEQQQWRHMYSPTVYQHMGLALVNALCASR